MAETSVELKTRVLGRNGVPPIRFEILCSDGTTMPVSSFACEVPVLRPQLGDVPELLRNRELIEVIAREVVQSQDAGGTDPEMFAELIREE